MPYTVAVMLAAALLACWSPEPWTPPPPPAEAREAMGLPEPLADVPDAVAPVPEGDDDALGGGVTGGAEPTPSPADPDGFDRYRAVLSRAPVTLVDDNGVPSCVVHEAGQEVEVRAEDPIRMKVWVPSCGVAGQEGWLQLGMVTRKDG